MCGVHYILLDLLPGPHSPSYRPDRLSTTRVEIADTEEEEGVFKVTMEMYMAPLHLPPHSTDPLIALLSSPGLRLLALRRRACSRSPWRCIWRPPSLCRR